MCNMFTYVRIALATTDVQSMYLEVPVTDETDQHRGSNVPELSQTLGHIQHAKQSTDVNG